MRANRVAVLYGIGDLRIEDRATPDPGPGELLVEVRSVGVCGSDVHYYQHGRSGGRRRAGADAARVGHAEQALTAGTADPAAVKAVVRPE